jgi:5'-3' exonuclease
MVKAGKVYATGTEDMDALTFGTNDYSYIFKKVITTKEDPINFNNPLSCGNHITTS